MAQEKDTQPDADETATPAEPAAAKKPAAKKPAAKKPAAAKAEAAAKEPAAKSETSEKKPGEAKPDAETAKAKPETEAKRAAKEQSAAAKKTKDSAETLTVRATAKHVRTSARKARLVCNHIRGKSVIEARAILAHSARSAAVPLEKLLESAVANAEHNHELVGDDLLIKSVVADEGPTIKRFRPRAQGRATPIHKRTAHLSIALAPKENS